MANKKIESSNKVLEAFPRNTKSINEIMSACYKAQKDVWGTKRWLQFRESVRGKKNPQEVLEKCREHFIIK